MTITKNPLSQLTSRHKPNFSKAFTIVELLVVIVVIGILATITIISYRGISDKAITAAIQSDLVNASKQLKLFQVENSAYPNSITDCPNPAAGNKCLKPSGSDIYTSYVKDNTVTPQGFCINVTNGTKSYKITSTTTLTPIEGDCATSTVTRTVDITATGPSTWDVPVNVTSVQIEAWGAQGGRGGYNGWAGHEGVGGNGGKVFGNLVVAYDQQLNIQVGSQGDSGSDAVTEESASYDGGTGGSSTITRDSVLLVSATGGGGGEGVWWTCGPAWSDELDDWDPCGNHNGFGNQKVYGDTGSSGSGNTYTPVTDDTITSGARAGNGRVLLTWQEITMPVF